jgi:hypothetical protein
MNWIDIWMAFLYLIKIIVFLGGSLLIIAIGIWIIVGIMRMLD